MPDEDEDDAMLLIIVAWAAWIAATACWLGML